MSWGWCAVRCDRCKSDAVFSKVDASHWIAFRGDHYLGGGAGGELSLE